MTERIKVTRLDRSDAGDRYMLLLDFGGRLVRLYLLPKELAPFTKVDLNPDAPNPPRWNEPGDPEDIEWASPPAPAGETSSEPEQGRGDR